MLPSWIRAYRLIFGLTALYAIYYNLTHLDDPYFWNFFTNQSNLLAGIVLILGSLVYARHLNPAWWDVIRGVAVISLMVTGIVYAVLLEGVYNPLSTDDHTWASSVMHQLIPIVMVLDIIIVPLGPRTPRWTVALYLIYPLFYLGWFLMRGTTTGWYGVCLYGKPGQRSTAGGTRGRDLGPRGHASPDHPAHRHRNEGSGGWQPLPA